MRYELLGNSGLRVSELALGTMTFGGDRGACRDACEDIFERYVDAGGNFIDTANRYTNGTSEAILGELIGGDRDRFVISTKYTLSTRPDDPNAGGNHRKNLFQSVDASLDRLGTEYIDLLWIHSWDGITPLTEVVRGLDDLITSGAVHYVGFSDAPAWVVARAQTLAEDRDWTPFSGLQIEYSLLERTVERELLPMARSLGIGVTAWGPLSGGVLTGKYNHTTSMDARGRVEQQELTDHQLEVAQTVIDVAGDLDATPAQVALAWIRHQPGQPIPIIGATNPDQLEDNLGSLDVTLEQNHLDQLDDVSHVELGFPHDFLEAPGTRRAIHGNAVDRLDTTAGTGPWR